MKKQLLFLLITAGFITCTPLSLAQKGPNLVIQKDTTDFGLVAMRNTKCQIIKFKNTGDASFEVSGIDPLKKEFNSNIQTPFTIQPNEEKIFNVCYSPTVPFVLDTQLVYIRTNYNAALAITLLFDISGSMSEVFSANESISKIKAANKAGMAFLDGIFNIQSISPEISIFSFNTGFFINHDFSSDKNDLKNSIPLQPSGNTNFYGAILKSIDEMNKKQNKKILIALTDGFHNTGNNTVSEVIYEAIKNNITIHTIGIGYADYNNLEKIATQTGGKYFTASTSQGLLDIYQKIANLIGTNSFFLKGRSSDDSIAIALTDIIHAKPGTTIEIPVKMRTVITPEFNIDTIELTISYNKTLLYSDVQPVMKLNTISERASNISSNSYFDLKNGYLKIVLSGDRFSNPKPDNVLFKAKFTVLFGNATSTDINIEHFKLGFKAGLDTNNLRLGVFQPGKVIIDSICYPCERFIDARERYGFELYQNSPNPYNPSTKISFTVYKAQLLKLAVYDVIGREIEIIYEGWQQPGTYSFNFNSAKLSSGIYFYRLQSNEYSFIKKMIISK